MESPWFCRVVPLGEEDVFLYFQFRINYEVFSIFIQCNVFKKQFKSH